MDNVKQYFNFQSCIFVQLFSNTNWSVVFVEGFLEDYEDCLCVRLLFQNRNVGIFKAGRLLRIIHGSCRT